MVNTGGWIKDEGYNSLKHAAIELNVNLILVIDQERLRVDLTRDLRDLPQKIKVLSLPKSGGVSFFLIIKRISTYLLISCYLRIGCYKISRYQSYNSQ